MFNGLSVEFRILKHTHKKFIQGLIISRRYFRVDSKMNINSAFVAYKTVFIFSHLTW